MARTFHEWANRFYPAPGASSKTDGFNINVSGNAEFQAMLAAMGPKVVTRALNIVRVQGMRLAVAANAAAPRGAKQKGRPGGKLARSFRYYDRPQWQQLGKVGVVVRSNAKYHHAQEFGVNAPGTRVVLYRDAAGGKVRRGQGIDAKQGRFRFGTDRLNPGVFAKWYYRDIRIEANPFFGAIVRATKDQYAQETRNAIQTYISRVSQGGE